MDGSTLWPQHCIACLIIDFQNDSGQVTVPLSYFVGFFVCESEALLVALLCLLGMEQGNTRESEGLYLECEATLTFENNSVAGGKKNQKSQHTSIYL